MAVRGGGHRRAARGRDAVPHGGRHPGQLGARPGLRVLPRRRSQVARGRVVLPAAPARGALRRAAHGGRVVSPERAAPVRPLRGPPGGPVVDRARGRDALRHRGLPSPAVGRRRDAGPAGLPPRHRGVPVRQYRYVGCGRSRGRVAVGMAGGPAAAQADVRAVRAARHPAALVVDRGRPARPRVAADAPAVVRLPRVRPEHADRPALFAGLAAAAHGAGGRLARTPPARSSPC